MRRSRSYRFGLVVAALFQLLFPTFASVADARAEAAAERVVYAHVEEHGSDRCAPVHAADCAVCRVLSGAAMAGEAPAVVLAMVVVAASSLPRVESAIPDAPSGRSPSQRAPPIA
jgi:hypothetical protein